MALDGEEKIIKILKDMDENTIVLIISKRYEDALNWQAPDKVLDYIKNNWKFLETVEYFSAYQKED